MRRAEASSRAPRALAIALAVLVISPIAAPVSDRYLFTAGIIAIALMVLTLVLWFMKRK